MSTLTSVKDGSLGTSAYKGGVFGQAGAFQDGSLGQAGAFQDGSLGSLLTQYKAGSLGKSGCGCGTRGVGAEVALKDNKPLLIAGGVVGVGVLYWLLKKKR